MKKILLIAVLSQLSTSCERDSGQSAISIGDYSGPNVLLGLGQIGDTAYHCTVDPSKVVATGAWRFGSGEPPLGPNQAMEAASAALKENFPQIGNFSSDVISLIRFKKGAVYQAIFTSNPERAIGEDSDMQNYMYMYVYMDGSVDPPIPAPPGN